MNILLINNTSGVHTALKKGLEQLGHNAEIVLAYPKNYQFRDAVLFPGYQNDSVLKKIITRLLFLPKIIKKSHDFDVINFIGGMSSFSFNGYFPQYVDLKLFKKNGIRLSYYGLGCDELSLPRIRKDSGKLMCNTCLAESDKLGIVCSKYTFPNRLKAVKHTKYFNYCISAMKEYEHCHESFQAQNVKHAKIPLPVDISNIDFRPATNSKEKLLIVHSPTRRGFKGTQVVQQAIVNLAKLLPNAFEFRMVEGLSYADYMKTMQDTDIYIDQVHSYSPGIAALENLAMGKIVFSGNSAEAKKYLPFLDESPIINASPDPDRLCIDLMDVITRYSEFTKKPLQGKKYIEKYHNPVKIAKQFIDIWYE